MWSRGLNECSARADSVEVLPAETLERILTSAQVGVVSADDSGLVTFANAEGARLAGRSAEDMVGQDIDVALSADASRGAWLWGPQANRRSSGEITLVRHGGHAYPARYWTSETELSPGVVGTTLTFVDISAERDQAEALLASEGRFRTLAEHAPMGIVQADALTGSTYLNEEASRLLGPEAGKPDGLGWTRRVHPADRLHVESAMRRAAARGVTFSGVLRLLDDDGQIMWVDARASHVVDEHGEPIGTIGTVLDVTEARRTELETEALRRVATEAAGTDADPASIFALVAEEVGQLLGSDGAAVARLEDDKADLVGQWFRREALRVDDDPMIPIDGAGATARVVRTGQPSRSVQGERVSVAAPIRALGTLWGVVGAVSLGRPGLPADAENHLGSFAQLLETTITSAESRSKLEFRAERDHLTGLWNHRQFHERLGAEMARARRSREPLALVLIDLDHFKQVNDVHGHQAGDEVLKDAAARLTDAARLSDVVARVGGEELAWLLPGTDAEGAVVAAERLRAAFHERPFAKVGSQTASFGLADTAEASTADEIYQHADVALYYAKQTGRDRWVRYSFEVAEDLIQAKAEARGIESPMLAGLRALGWSMDGRSPELEGHSERVADLAVRFGAALNWSIEAAAQLREAALAHGVGQLGLRGKVASGQPITAQERIDLRTNTELGTRTASELLEDDQVRWVMHHLEHFDGRGYPDGLSGDDVPDGAYVIGLAEAWDRLTVVGAHETGERLSADAAIEEVRRLRGRRFAPLAVDALERLFAAGALPEPVHPAAVRSS